MWFKSSCEYYNFWNISFGHGHPFHFHSTWTPLGGCGRMTICQIIFPSSFLFLICWHSVSVWETNLGLQETKLLLFSTACQGLQNCMLCQNYLADQVINWYISVSCQKINNSHTLSWAVAWVSSPTAATVYWVDPTAMCCTVTFIIFWHTTASIL